jgi:hypothetical protein
MRTHRLAAPAALLALLVGASACDDAATRVALPAADAPPAAVARAYVEALDQGDRDALRALTTEYFAEEAEAWLPNLKHIRVAGMRPARRDDRIGSAVRHPEVVVIQVELDLDLVDPGRSGFSTDGRTTWGYVLVRDAPTDPWRVDGEGSG